MEELRIPIHALSVNQMYQIGNRRWFITNKGREYKKAILNILNGLELKHIKKPNKVKLIIQVYFKTKREHDADNVLKPLIDILKNVIMEDDAQIYKIIITKHIDAERDEIIIKYGEYVIPQ